MAEAIECPRCHRVAPLPGGTLSAQVECQYCHHTFTLSDSVDETHSSSAPSSPPVMAAMSLPVGEPVPDTIGPYLLQRKLGSGAMGEVWLAHDPSLDRLVAVKLLPAALADDPKRLKRFLREARLAAKLDHPRTVTIFPAGVDGQRPYIAMQYVDGGSLEELIGHGQPVEWRKAARAIAQAAEGLGAAHKHGLVHRDVKPANLMCTAKGDVKVVDFGLARAQLSNTQLTQRGVRMGTPAYMAPEQWMGQEADARTDLYSLVCSLYHLLTGRLPFEASSLASLGYQHCQVPPPDPRKCVRSLPEELCRILIKGLQKEPDQRYQSADELVADLQATLNRPHTRRPKMALTQWGRGWLAISAAAILLAIGVGIYLASTGRFSQPIEQREASIASGDHPASASSSKPAPPVETPPVASEPPKSAAEPPPPKPRPATFEVQVEPPEAKVTVLGANTHIAGSGATRTITVDAPNGETEFLILGSCEGYETLEEKILPGPGENRQLSLRLNKLPPSLSLEVDSLSLGAGQVQRFPVRVSRRNVQGSVQVRFEGLPPGIALQPAIIEADAAEVVVEITVPEEVEKSECVAQAVAVLGETITSVQFQVRTEPQSANTYLSRGVALLNDGEFDQAVKQFDRAIGRDAALAAAYLKRARAYCEMERFAEAVADCSKAVDLGSKDAETYVLRAWAYNAQDKYNEAMIDCTEVIESLDANNTEAYYHRAFAYNQQGEHALAIADCTAVLDRLGPNAAQAHANRAYAYLHTGQPVQALADLSAARRLNPKDAVICLGLGLTHADLGEYEEAAKAFTQAIEQDPNFAAAYRYRGLAYAFNELQSDEAERDFQQAIQLEPNYSCAYVDWGVTYSIASHAMVDKSRADAEIAKQWNEKLEQAIARFDQAIAAAAMERKGPVRRGREFMNFSCVDAGCRCPTVAYVQRGLARMKLEDYEGAAKDFSQAIALDANCADAFYCRGWANAFAQQVKPDVSDESDLGTAARLAPAMFGEGEVRVGTEAPVFTGLLGTDDTAHSLADYQASQIIVLVFFAPDCQVSGAYAERLIKLDEDYRTKGVQIVAIQAGPGDRLAQMINCVRKFKFPFPYLSDPTRDTATRYHAPVTPTAFVLDSKRNVAYMGAIDDSPFTPDKVKTTFLRDALDSVLSDRKPAVAQTPPFG